MPAPDPTPAIAYASHLGARTPSSATPLPHTNPVTPSANPPYNEQQTTHNKPQTISNEPSPDTVALAFAPLFDAPERHPGGAMSMPPIPREARTRAASYERQNYIVCRCELILVDWIDRFAVNGVTAQFDLDRFERATMILWRLTSIRKSLDAKAADPNSPDAPNSAKLDVELHAAMTDLATLGSPTGSADAPVRNSANANQPAPPATIENEQHTTNNEPSPDPQPAIGHPHSPCVTPASVRAVPSCPTLSPHGIEAFLSRNEKDLASLPGARASSPASAPSNQPAPSLATNNEQQTTDNEQPSPSPLPCPNPSANLNCADCADPDCLARIAAPVHLPNLLNCSHFCRECRKAQSCPYTLPRYRASPS